MRHLLMPSTSQSPETCVCTLIEYKDELELTTKLSIVCAIRYLFPGLTVQRHFVNQTPALMEFIPPLVL